MAHDVFISYSSKDKQTADATCARLERYGAILRTLARVDSISHADGGGKGAVQLVVDEASYFLPLAEIIDLAAERNRLVKEIGKLAGEIGKLDAKLDNPAFIARAPAEIVLDQRDRRAEALALQQKLEDAVKRIAG